MNNYETHCIYQTYLVTGGFWQQSTELLLAGENEWIMMDSSYQLPNPHLNQIDLQIINLDNKLFLMGTTYDLDLTLRIYH